MDNKLLLVKAITLVYLNGKLDEKQDDLQETCQKVLQTVRPTGKQIISEFGTDALTELRDILVEMINQPSSTQYDEKELRQRFKISLGNEYNLYEALSDALLTGEETQDDILRMYTVQKNTIYSHINKNKISDILKEYYVRAMNHPDTIDYKNLSDEISNKISPLVSGTAEHYDVYKHPAIVCNTDMGNAESVKNVFTKTIDELDTGGVIRTPYQGVNRMLGSHGGIRRGEMAVVTALSHNYKSGFVMDLWLGCAMFNRPHLRDETKKPLNLRISFENTTQQDFVHMYVKLYESEHKVSVDPKSVDPIMATNYVMEKVNVNGWNNQIIHIDPTEYTFKDLFALLDQIEKDGYEIQLLTIDYLNMMSKAGCKDGATGDDVRDLFRRVRNYCLRRGIAIVTPHQFSSEARKFERLEPKDFVKKVSAKGYYDGCMRLEQEMDLEISLNIVKFNNESYLTMNRGKHRGVVTPLAHQFTVYKFDEFGGIPMDVDGEDLSRKSVGGETEAEGGASPWFEGII